MNDEVKELLIDLIDYYNTMGTESDPGITAFESVARRASKALERHAKEKREDKQNKSELPLNYIPDPFEHPGHPSSYKSEDEW